MYLYAKILPSQLGQPVPNSCLENFGFRYRTAGSLSESEGIKERKQLFFFLLVSICYVLLQSTPMTRDCVCVFFFLLFFPLSWKKTSHQKSNSTESLSLPENGTLEHGGVCLSHRCVQSCTIVANVGEKPDWTDRP